MTEDNSDENLTLVWSEAQFFRPALETANFIDVLVQVHLPAATPATAS